MWLQLSIRIWGLSALNKIILSLDMQLVSIFMTKFLIEKKIIKMTTESNAVVILSTYDFYNFIFFCDGMSGTHSTLSQKTFIKCGSIMNLL